MKKILPPLGEVLFCWLGTTYTIWVKYISS